MTDKNPVLMVLIISIMGGLIAGIICTIVIIYSINVIVQDLSDQVQNISIDCSEEINPFAMQIKLGDITYYCLAEIKAKGLGKEYTISPSPQG